MKKGNYLGTEIDEKWWWKRYRSPGFFALGSGEFWMGVRFAVSGRERRSRE